MRAIDADALEKAISISHSMIDDYGIKIGYEICMRLVKDAPTIESRKKGKWIDRGWSGDGRGNSWWHEWECSECKHITKGAKWDFCPNCGADMREGAERRTDEA